MRKPFSNKEATYDINEYGIEEGLCHDCGEEMERLEKTGKKII
jgi:hypothetical protein